MNRMLEAMQRCIRTEKRLGKMYLIDSLFNDILLARKCYRPYCRNAYCEHNTEESLKKRRGRIKGETEHE